MPPSSIRRPRSRNSVTIPGGRRPLSRRIRSQAAIGLAAFLLLTVGPALRAKSSLTSSGATGEFQDRTVTGLVLDPDGAGIPGALLEARDKSGKTAGQARTDSRGAFALALPDGTYELSVSAQGFRPLQSLPLQVSAATASLSLALELPHVEEQIVVTATLTDAPLSQVGSSVTVISGDDLVNRGVDSVAEALRRLAGLTIVQSGGAGQITSLFVRGGESDYTKVLVDGIPVNEPGGSYNFAGLPAWNIDRIEVARGPQSALYGSDAIAGVVQIFTRRGASEGYRPRPHVRIEGGSYSTFSYAAGIEAAGNRVDYSASFSRFDTDNNVINGSFNQTGVAGSFGVRPSEKTELRAVFRGNAGRAGVPGQWAFHQPEPDEFYRRRDAAAGVTLSHLTRPRWTQKLSYSISDSRQYSEDPGDSGLFYSSYGSIRAPSPAYDFPYQTLNQTRRQSITYQSDLSLPGSHLVTAGAEYEREQGVIGDPNSAPLSAVRNNFGAFVQDQYAFRNRLFAAAGVRLEHNASFGFFAAPRLSLAFHLHPPTSAGFWKLTKLKSNFGLGIKEPSLVESYSASPYFQGNPDLRPEKSLAFDIGIEQYFGRPDGVMEVTYFENRYRDQIGFLVTDYSTYEGSFFNLGKSRSRGVEAALRQSLGSCWEITAAYTLLSSAVLESAVPFDPAFAEGNPLFRRPRHSGHFELRWKPGRWTLGASVLAEGRRVDSDFAGLGLYSNPGYGILNLIVNFRLFEHSALYAVANNALDRSYMEVLGYPALGAHFRFGITTGF